MDIRLGPLWFSIVRDNVRAWGFGLVYPTEVNRPTLNLFAGHWEVQIVSDSTWRQSERIQKRQRQVADEMAEHFRVLYAQVQDDFQTAVEQAAERATAGHVGAEIASLWQRSTDDGDS